MKSDTDLSLEAKLPLNSPRFDPSRLAEDHALAVEAQDEMKNIITKFVDLLKEEEQQLEVQAGERIDRDRLKKLSKVA